MRILMLGASGKLGRMMRQVWQDAEGDHSEIIPVSRTALDEGLVWEPGDDPRVLPQIDAILALWGVTSGGEDALSANVMLAHEAARLGDILGASCVLHCSSAAVYAPGSMRTETSRTEPPTAYGKSKLAMERAIARMSGDVRHVMLRIGSVAGAESLFGNLRPGHPLTLDRFADGQGPFRSYIAPQDLARVTDALMRAPSARGAFNVAAPYPVRMQDIVKQAGATLEWRPAPETALQHVTLNTERLMAICPLEADTAAPSHLVAGARASGVWP